MYGVSHQEIFPTMKF